MKQMSIVLKTKIDRKRWFDIFKLCAIGSKLQMDILLLHIAYHILIS